MSTTVATKTDFTPDDLRALSHAKHYELIDGQLVERNVSFQSSAVAAEINRLIGNHCKENGLAWVLDSECGYQCFPDKPGRVRRADVSFLHRDRLPAEQFEEGHVRVAPDLAVEVVSPGDLVYEVDQKVREYLGAGVRLVWVVRPEGRVVEVYRGGGSSQLLREHEELSGEEVLPGFRCRVADLFPPGPTK